jgi:hypothetical protein
VQYADPEGRRYISASEAKFIKEVLGDIGIKATKDAIVFSISGNRAGSTNIAYFGQIWLSKGISSNPLASKEGRNTFIHEVFHQIQEFFEPSGLLPNPVTGNSAMAKLIGEQWLYNDGKGEPIYDFGDYTKINLSQYSKLSDIPYYEAQAQMVGDFAELYSTAKSGGGLSDNQKTAIKDMANILNNSGFKSEAIQWVQENY